MLKVCIANSSLTAEDDGQGGIRRVIEGQLAHLPAQGIELIDDPAAADVLAGHIGLPADWLREYPEKTFVAHNHGFYWAEYQWPRGMLEANRFALDAIVAADACTVPTEWVARIVERHTARKPVVIPHGIDLDAWLRPETTPAVPYVLWDKTRPDPVCDPRIVNQVAALLPDVQFVTTFGEPTENVGVVGRVAFSRAKAFTRNAAVYLATTRETFGIATLQAMACEIPVAGFNWGGQAELLTHGSDSYLVEPDDIQGLAEAIRWCLAHRDEAGAAARAKARLFHWERAARLYADLYRSAHEARVDASRPRVSFVVRAFNMAPWIKATLDSIQGQKLEDFECIVVNDGSTDETAAIAKTFESDARFRVLDRQNGGIVDAMNAGVGAARGRYVMAVDADDMVTGWGPEQLASALDRDRTIAAAYGNLYFTDADGVTPIDFGPQGTGPGHSKWPLPFNWEWQKMGRNLLPYCSMYRREAWQLTGGHRRRLTTAEDADFWLRISSYGFRPKMVTEADVLVYRVRGDSYSRRAPAADWAGWFPWRVESWLSPAGAAAGLEGLSPSPVNFPSLDPPAISVIIPVGPGHENLLMDAIDSVEAQGFRWWEVIVANDSGAALPPLPSWVRVVNPPGERFQSVAAARNAAIAEARAKWYIPLDADDILEPTALAVFWEEHRLRPDVIFTSDFWENPRGTWQVFEVGDWDARKLLRRSEWTVTQLTPVAAWQKVGGYPVGMEWEDWAFQLALAEAGYCSARIARPLFSYRKNTGHRAAENFNNREAGKAKIADRFADYIEGKRELMSCGCGSSSVATVYPPPATVDMTPVAGMSAIRYDGDNVASFAIRGQVSNRTYYFAKGEEKFVLDDDVAPMVEVNGFTRAPNIPQGSGDAPSLVSAQA